MFNVDLYLECHVWSLLVVSRFVCSNQPDSLPGMVDMEIPKVQGCLPSLVVDVSTGQLSGPVILDGIELLKGLLGPSARGLQVNMTD